MCNLVHMAVQVYRQLVVPHVSFPVPIAGLDNSVVTVECPDKSEFSKHIAESTTDVTLAPVVEVCRQTHVILSNINHSFTWADIRRRATKLLEESYRADSRGICSSQKKPYVEGAKGSSQRAAGVSDSKRLSYAAATKNPIPALF